MKHISVSRNINDDMAIISNINISEISASISAKNCVVAANISNES